MVKIHHTGDRLWDRIERAVDKVRERVRRVSEALDGAGIPFAIVGGNAVQVWVAQVDEAAIRNTRDVDILLQRDSLDAAINAMQQHGFVYHELMDVAMFLDGSDGKPSEGVHVLFAGEKVKQEYPAATPTLDVCKTVRDLQTVPLESLVLMKLTSFRRKDQVHIQDMIQVGLIDQSWTERYDEPLKSRLQELIDDPYG